MSDKLYQMFGSLILNSSVTRAFILNQSSELCVLIPPKNVFQGITVDTVVYTLRKAAQHGKSFQVKAMKNGSIAEVVKYDTKQYVDGRLPISTSTDIGSANLVLPESAIISSSFLYCSAK